MGFVWSFLIHYITNHCLTLTLSIVIYSYLWAVCLVSLLDHQLSGLDWLDITVKQSESNWVTWDGTAESDWLHCLACPTRPVSYLAHWAAASLYYVMYTFLWKFHKTFQISIKKASVSSDIFSLIELSFVSSLVWLQQWRHLDSKDTFSQYLINENMLSSVLSCGAFARIAYVPVVTSQ